MKEINLSKLIVKGELRITSVDLTNIINEFRKMEGRNELAHYDLYKKIKKEVETLRKLGIVNDGNFSVVEYIDSKGEKRPCYSLNKSGMLQMLNSESTLVRYKTTEYIENLEKEAFKTICDYDNAKAQMDLLAVTANTLNLNDSSKLLIATKIYEDCNIPTTYLPAYTDSRGILKSATELLKENNISISTIKFNKIMIDKGYLIEVERTSGKDKSKIKKFKNLAKTEFGENQISPKNPKETQPMYYENKFLELLKELGIK